MLVTAVILIVSWFTEQWAVTVRVVVLNCFLVTNHTSSCLSKVAFHRLIAIQTYLFSECDREYWHLEILLELWHDDKLMQMLDYLNN